jgi:hypothetical protein
MSYEIRNIQIFVDSIALAAGGAPEKTVFIYDDSPSGSTLKGTSRTSTAVYPGLFVRWEVNAIDTQAPVWISGVSFGAKHAETPCAAEGAWRPPAAVALQQARITPQQTPWLFTWAGIVPACVAPNVGYPYVIHLNFGYRTLKSYVVEGPQLIWPVGYPAMAPGGSPAGATDEQAGEVIHAK